jgi:hypothetical protein
MAYIGNKPTVGNFQICDAISVVNGQAAYTMQVGSVNVIPQSANHMIVSLNGTIQKPNSSFTVSGSTITFASNLVTNDVIDFIQILGDVLDLGVPSDATVSTAKIVDDAVTLAKMASGTDGNIISYDASGNPVAVATGSAGQILTSAGAGAPPTFAAPAAAGKILQVKNQYNNSLVSSTATASTHFDICAGSMTFTPTSSSSNILCMLSAGMDIASNGVNCGWTLSLSLSQSGGLSVSNDYKTEFGYYSAAGTFGDQRYGQNLSMIESYANASTNAITITGQGNNYSEGNSQTVKFQKSSLIVMEWVV